MLSPPFCIYITIVSVICQYFGGTFSKFFPRKSGVNPAPLLVLRGFCLWTFPSIVIKKDPPPSASLFLFPRLHPFEEGHLLFPLLVEGVTLGTSSGSGVEGHHLAPVPRGVSLLPADEHLVHRRPFPRFEEDALEAMLIAEEEHVGTLTKD